MSHHLIIDCFKDGQEVCVLNSAGEKQIKLQSRVLPANYRYYLTINNHSQQACSYFLSFQTQDALVSGLELAIKYGNELLFDDLIDQFLATGQQLNYLSQNQSELYTLDFYLPPDIPEFNFNFDVNLKLDCLVVEKPIMETAGKVLGVEENNYVEAVLIKDQGNSFSNQLKKLSPRVWFFSGLIFLFLLILVFVSGKLLTSSKKGINEQT